MKLKKSKLSLLLLAMLNLTACNSNNTKTIVYCLHRHTNGDAYSYTFLCCEGCKKIGGDDGSALEDYILNENKDGWFATECEKVDLDCGSKHIHYLITYSK